jgi:hypothetical protein
MFSFGFLFQLGKDIFLVFSCNLPKHAKTRHVLQLAAQPSCLACCCLSLLPLLSLHPQLPPCTTLGCFMEVRDGSSCFSRFHTTLLNR